MIPLAILINFPILIIILRKQYLTVPLGVTTAASLGVILFVIQPFFWLALLIFFFSSSVLSKIKAEEKSSVASDFAKGSTTRDTMQVVANSLVPLLFACGYLVFEILPIVIESNIIDQKPFSPFFTGVFVSYAVHNADTWATEIGLLSKRTPRLVTRLTQKVNAGTSGGITIDGCIASILGSATLAIFYLIAITVISPAMIFNYQTIIIFFLIVAGGFIGSLVDSIEGATIQGIYYCKHCEKETESNPHPRCGNETKLKRGNKLINNDFVNASSSLVVASFSYIIIALI
jgi:uncharacterized protein (TIGR00297 family)